MWCANEPELNVLSMVCTNCLALCVEEKGVSDSLEGGVGEIIPEPEYRAAGICNNSSRLLS